MAPVLQPICAGRGFAGCRESHRHALTDDRQRWGLANATYDEPLRLAYAGALRELGAPVTVGSLLQARDEHPDLARKLAGQRRLMPWSKPRSGGGASGGSAAAMNASSRSMKIPVPGSVEHQYRADGGDPVRKSMPR